MSVCKHRHSLTTEHSDSLIAVKPNKFQGGQEIHPTTYTRNQESFSFVNVGWEEGEVTDCLCDCSFSNQFHRDLHQPSATTQEPVRE